MANHFITGLVATLPRLETLINRSLPSITQQTRHLDHLIIVSDQREFTAGEQALIRHQCQDIPTTILHNKEYDGAASCWNTGIDYANQLNSQAYLAILDDDDSWDPDHIEACEKELQDTSQCDLVLSGLRIRKDNEVIENPLPEIITVDDFLKGNPGWQGSNTFVLLQSLISAGKFNAQLQSTNDRDLAIRLLSTGQLVVKQTGRFTATWFCLERSDALSQPGNPKKLRGLAQFYQLHLKDRTDKSIETHFFKRSETLFGFTRSQILTELDKLSVRRVNV